MNYQTFDEPNSKKPKHQTACYDVSYFKEADDPTSSSSLRDFLVVLALTFHAVFEGIAVGLENEANDVWLLFAGINLEFYRVFRLKKVRKKWLLL